jgi:hypothetical protein
MTNKIMLLMLLPLGIVSCSDSNNCNANLDCTEIYVTLTVNVQDSNGDPILLDSAYSIHINSGMIYQNDESLMLQDQGSYILWTDSQLDITDKNGSEIQFEGWLSGEKLVTEKFTVGHDCCHVELLEGNELIIIQ